MNDIDRELIELVLQKAGSAGEQGFAHLVRYYATDGMIGVIGYGCLLALCAYLFRRLLRWDTDEEGAFIVRGICMFIVIIAAVCFVFGFFNSITQVIAPEGAAIRAVLQ